MFCPIRAHLPIQKSKQHCRSLRVVRVSDNSPAALLHPFPLQPIINGTHARHDRNSIVAASRKWSTRVPGAKPSVVEKFRRKICSDEQFLNTEPNLDQFVMVVLSHNAPDLLVAVSPASPPTIACFIISIVWLFFRFGLFTQSRQAGLIPLQLNKTGLIVGQFVRSVFLGFDEIIDRASMGRWVDGFLPRTGRLIDCVVVGEGTACGQNWKFIHLVH
ncbi:hypothetical protein Zmor_019758 [Zophobas morio]|uniref:Uncharacterized protein n=1 Tax=Zophobas morio TaxID=2755281 RepID=A0AA38I6G0_9CUCU|nr:hypothetical protein Zmor_019758 [Zophobas morio]